MCSKTKLNHVIHDAEYAQDNLLRMLHTLSPLSDKVEVFDTLMKLPHAVRSLMLSSIMQSTCNT